MQTVILCGGQGTRLREETEFRPKPMVHIGPKPVLWHIMKRYAHYGHRDFILCLGYKGEMIKEYFYHYELMNSDFTLELGKNESVRIHGGHGEAGWRITLADTGAIALKGARIKRIERYIKGDQFLLTYGDGVADIDLDRLVAFHNEHGRIATLTGVNYGSRFGEMRLEGDRIAAFREKPEDNDDPINGGFLVLNREIFGYLEDRDTCDFEYGPLERLAQEGELMLYRHRGSWACMDNLRDVEYLNGLWSRGEAFWKCW